MNMLGTYLKDLRIMAAILATALLKVDYWYSVLDNFVLKYATTLKKKISSLEYCNWLADEVCIFPYFRRYDLQRLLVILLNFFYLAVVE